MTTYQVNIGNSTIHLPLILIVSTRKIASFSVSKQTTNKYSENKHVTFHKKPMKWDTTSGKTSYLHVSLYSDHMMVLFAITASIIWLHFPKMWNKTSVLAQVQKLYILHPGNNLHHQLCPFKKKRFLYIQWVFIYLHSTSLN